MKNKKECCGFVCFQKMQHLDSKISLKSVNPGTHTLMKFDAAAITIIMMMYMYLIAMHVINTIEVSTLAEENDLKKITVNKKPPQTKLKFKRGITMDSGACNNAMPWRMVIQKSGSRESEGSKTECTTCVSRQ